MNQPVLTYFILIGLCVMGIFKNSVSLTPLRFHCNNYILSTYLYFILNSLTRSNFLNSKYKPIQFLSCSKNIWTYSAAFDISIIYCNSKNVILFK